MIAVDGGGIDLVGVGWLDSGVGGTKGKIINSFFFYLYHKFFFWSVKSEPYNILIIYLTVKNGASPVRHLVMYFTLEST